MLIISGADALMIHSSVWSQPDRGSCAHFGIPFDDICEVSTNVFYAPAGVYRTRDRLFTVMRCCLEVCQAGVMP